MRTGFYVATRIRCDQAHRTQTRLARLPTPDLVTLGTVTNRYWVPPETNPSGAVQPTIHGSLECFHPPLPMTRLLTHPRPIGRLVAGFLVSNTLFRRGEENLLYRPWCLFFEAYLILFSGGNIFSLFSFSYEQNLTNAKILF